MRKTGRPTTTAKTKVLNALIRERRNGHGWKRSYQLAGNAKITRQATRRALFDLYHTDQKVMRRDIGKTWYGKPIYEYRVLPEVLGMD